MRDVVREMNENRNGGGVLKPGVFSAFFGMRAFLHFVCVPLCFVKSSEGWKEALPPFESAMATVGRMVS